MVLGIRSIILGRMPYHGWIRPIQALILLVHVEVGIRILNITQVWTLLQVAQILSTVCVRAVCSNTVLTFETSHCEVVGDLAKTGV